MADSESISAKSFERLRVNVKTGSRLVIYRLKFRMDFYLGYSVFTTVGVMVYYNIDCLALCKGYAVYVSENCIGRYVCTSRPSLNDILSIYGVIMLRNTKNENIKSITNF